MFVDTEKEQEIQMTRVDILCLLILKKEQEIQMKRVDFLYLFILERGKTTDSI